MKTSSLIVLLLVVSVLECKRHTVKSELKKHKKQYISYTPTPAPGTDYYHTYPAATVYHPAATVYHPAATVYHPAPVVHTVSGYAPVLREVV